MAHFHLIDSALKALTDSSVESVLQNYAKTIEACAKLENVPLEGE
jgi:hypothetical protein